MKTRGYVLSAILAAAFYALNAPLSKLLLESVSPTMMASLLYLGAGGGLLLFGAVQRVVRHKERRGVPMMRSDLPYVIAMIGLDCAAPILLMFGLRYAAAQNVSLLNNFEIVATAVIARIFFREKITPRVWGSIALITIACMLLSVEEAGSLNFSAGSVLVLLACVCWGVENNCTRRLSVHDPLEIVVIKGFGSGAGAMVIALAVGEAVPPVLPLLLALLLGFLAYGMSIYFYIYAQRGLGAAKTSAWYALAPFLSAGLSLLLFSAQPSPFFGLRSA